VETLKNMRESLENRIVMLAGEIQRLMAKNTKKDQENEGLQEQVKRVEDSLTELAPLEGDNRRLYEDIAKVHDELTLWKSRYTEQEDIANKALSAREGLENKVALLSSEIERQNIKNRNAKIEIENHLMTI
jgi:uncharacterized small protein (DUF1192 family)